MFAVGDAHRAPRSTFYHCLSALTDDDSVCLHTDSAYTAKKQKAQPGIRRGYVSKLKRKSGGLGRNRTTDTRIFNLPVKHI
jgi:hypothetical protein